MEEKYPLFGDRVQSWFIDQWFRIALVFIFSVVIDKTGSTPDWVRKVAFFSIWLVYEPLCMSLGCTLGNYIKGIRVRSDKDRSRRLNIFQALARYLFKVLTGWISFSSVMTNTKRQAIHDFIAGSVVIKL